MVFLSTPNKAHCIIKIDASRIGGYDVKRIHSRYRHIFESEFPNYEREVPIAQESEVVLPPFVDKGDVKQITCASANSMPTEDLFDKYTDDDTHFETP